MVPPNFTGDDRDFRCPQNNLCDVLLKLLLRDHYYKPLRAQKNSLWSRIGRDINQSLCPHSLLPTDQEIIWERECGCLSGLFEYFTLIAKHELHKQREKK